MTASSCTAEPSPAPVDDALRALLDAARALVPADAAVLLRLDGDALVPVAQRGLSEDALGRRFALALHPRLATLMRHPDGHRFPPDSALPDPYDGLVAGHEDALLAVHDCLGAALTVDGRPWGLVTLDALDSHAFDSVDAPRLRALTELLESGLSAAERARSLALQARRDASLARELRGDGARRELLGQSAAMQRLRREIDTVAPSDLSVLILGETGTGKELVAQRLHAGSARAQRPLVQINCAALPETLADSELFGHRKGAFTGATQDRLGKFELADGGTLLLDEVGELPLAVQAKLLRALQSGELQRPGSDRLLRVDVRVLAATNRDLGAEVAAGRFRADLYHRLSVYPLRVPPLRERGRDALTLAGGFLEDNQRRLGARNLRLSAAAREALLAWPWPGNVRELEHVISRAALRAWSAAQAGARGQRWIAIEPEQLGLSQDDPAASVSAAAVVDRSTAPVAAPSAPSSVPEDWLAMSLSAATERFQREWLRALLAAHPASRAAAARQAGMDRSNFHRLLKKLGLD